MLKIDRLKRKRRIRGRISGTSDRPRLSVYRSNKYIYVQAIDDIDMKTLAAAKGADASVVGHEIGEALKKLKKEAVVFDRGGFRYHGRVKILADAAREAGLKF